MNRFQRWFGIVCSITFALSLFEMSVAQDLARVELDLGNGVKLELARIEPGSFQQGSPDDESGREGDENRHLVRLSAPFYLGTAPVTIEQFERFVAESKYVTEAEAGKSGGYGFNGKELVQQPIYHWKNPGFEQSARHPVTIVTVPDAMAFLSWANRKAAENKKSIQFSLPTEAQWEYACRAGTTSKFYSGNEDADLQKIAWFKSNASNGTRPVKQKTPNGWGLHDMSGNVWEWCSDVYAPYSTSEAVDPLQTLPAPGEKVRQVLRGGSWMRDAKRARSASRYRSDARTRNAEIGFRVAAAIPASLTPLPSSTNAVPAKTSASVPTAPTESVMPALEPATSPAPSQVFPPSMTLEEFENSRPGFGFGRILGVGCFCTFFLGLVGILVAAVRFVLWNNRQTQSNQTLYSSNRTRTSSSHRTGLQSKTLSIVPSADGFWCDTSLYPLGTIIYYHYLLGAQTYQDHFVVEHPERQFIYTGDLPAEVEVELIEPPAAQLDNNPSQPTGGVLEAGSATYLDSLGTSPGFDAQSSDSPSFFSANSEPPAY